MKKSQRIFLKIILAFCCSISLGTLFEHLYFNSDSQSLPINKVQEIIYEKERQAKSTIQTLNAFLLNNQFDSIRNVEFINDDISYYIFKKNELIFWSSNKLDFSNLDVNILKKSEQFIQLNNAFAIALSVPENNYRTVAFIKIKDNYSITNSYLINKFAEDINVNDKFNITTNQKDSNWAIFSESGEYLFTFTTGSHVIYNKIFAYLSAFFFSLAFLLFFMSLYRLDLIFGPNVFKLHYFLIALFFYTGVVCLCLIFNIPNILFYSDLFSPIYYGSGNFIKSLGHLLLLSIFFCCVVVTFYFKVNMRYLRLTFWKGIKWMILVEAISVAVFAMIMWIFQDLLLNSSFDVVINKIENVSIYTLVSIVMIMCWMSAFILIRDRSFGQIKFSFEFWQVVVIKLIIWAISAVIYYLFGLNEVIYSASWYTLLTLIIDYTRYRSHRNTPYHLMILAVFIYSNFIVWFIHRQIQVKKINQYAVVADNIASGSEANFDFLSQRFLIDMEEDIEKDSNIVRYIETNDQLSNERLLRYLNKYYFVGYWNNYNVRLYHTNSKDDAYQRYYQQISDGSIEQKGTSHFYRNRVLSNTYDYLGIFSYPKTYSTITLFLELSRKNKSMNYGSQDMMFDSERNGMNYSISSAKYLNNNLLSQNGIYSYAPTLDPTLYRNSRTYNHNGYVHYLYQKPNNVSVVISEQQPQPIISYLIFLSYLFTFFLIMAFITYSIWLKSNAYINLKSRFTSRIQNTLLTFTLASLTVVFGISITYLYFQYEKFQENELLAKTEFVKNQLQNVNKQNKNLLSYSSAELSFAIQDAAKLYQTDIHLYNLSGEMIATSRPFIFNKGLISKLMSATPYFKLTSNVWLQHEKLGKLNYLASYATLRDNNNNPFAFIELPSFYSSQDLRKELFTFFALFLNIYVIIILIASALTLFVSKGLALPLKTIEEKMKAIKLGKRNEKISYKLDENDEIGKLIMQYNLMVDELSESAQILARSERESAWREMARQIAHEIKNPLTPMKLTIQQLQRAKEMDQETFNSYFEKTSSVLIEQIDNLSRIATEFSNFARMPAPKLIQLNIYTKLHSVINLFSQSTENVEIQFNANVNKAIILADSEQMTQLFNNLIKNAIQAIPADREGKINITLDKNNDWVFINIADNGTGISAEVQDKLFTPNFTTKNSGMGLGLTIVKNIVIASGGEIKFSTIENAGTTFMLKFPLVV